MRHCALAVACGFVFSSFLWAQVSNPPATTSSKPTASAGGIMAQRQAAAAEYYKKVLTAYMMDQWPEFADLVKTWNTHNQYMTPEMRVNGMYMRSSAAEFRPAWWKNCLSTSNVSFTATIWGRNFTANYRPTDELGAQRSYIGKDRIDVIVSWRPNFVDNPKDADGGLSKVHSIKKGNIGETIVWHELGHNYITSFLPINQVIDLYDNHEKLFEHLQEFYADLTAIYHCGPRARLATLMIRLDDIESGRELEGHSRASYAIGSLLLSEILGNPAKWPSFHFPGQVPAKDIERNTIIYMYENIDPGYTLAEDRAIRELVSKFIGSQGEQVLRSKGEFKLSNKLSFQLMEPGDREFAAKRDAWVKDQLAKCIKDGRADKPVATKPATGLPRGFRIGDDPKRIEVPWDN